MSRSERLRREYERREALSLIGQMTATLAHEIRNAIGSVKGYAQLAAEKTSPDDPRSETSARYLRGRHIEASSATCSASQDGR
jgi:nitrogen-specific signal transduction histidine kinase